MVFYVIVATFPMTLPMNKFTGFVIPTSGNILH